MNNASSLEEQLLDMDSQTERLRLKFQKEISKKISIYIKKLLEMERSQNIFLQRELAQVMGYLRENQIKCKCSPVECKLCDKLFKNRNTLKQHQRAVHSIFRREPRSSGNRIATDLEYQLTDYQEKGNENTWDPSI